VNSIENWLIVFGLTNIILYFFSLFIFVPKTVFKTPLSDCIKIFFSNFKYLLIIFSVVIIHLLEVNIIDSFTSNIIGIDFAHNFYFIENGIVYWFSQNWVPALVIFFAVMYIAVYPFTIWFSPLYFLITDDKKSLKFLTYGLLIIYLISFPFYLFFPVSNVYTYFGIQSALESVIPGINQFFYSTTTTNNCFPSLHVAMTLLIAKSVSMTNNKKLKFFTYFCAITVIISVIYLAIHWIIDIIGGIIIAFLSFQLQKILFKAKKLE
jgi:membrane-associated phospholipid phosphatase